MLSGNSSTGGLVPAQSVELVNPLTGEVLSLSLGSPDIDLGRALADLRAHVKEVYSAIRVISDEFLRRQDRATEWTTRLPGMIVRGDSPKLAEQEVFDGAALRDELLRFVDWDVLDITAVDAAVEVVVSYEVHKDGINKLRKLGGRIAEVVDEHARMVPRERRVTVKATK